MADGKIDGQFIIKKGGITQGIANELGLTNSECKQIGSIWTEIIKEFDNPDNMQVTNNKDDAPSKNNNYLVYSKTIVQFSKECWQKIVSLINNALHKNIKIDEVDELTKTSKETNNLTQNRQNLKNAYNELSSMNGLFINKYNLNKEDFNKALTNAYQEIAESLPNSPCDTADLAMNILMNAFEKTMLDKRDAIKNALIEVAQHYRDVENANIANYSCKDIISNIDMLNEVTNLYLGVDNEEQIESYKEVAKDVLKDLIENFDNMTFPKEVNKRELINKLKNYNLNNLKNLGQHYRFGINFNENPSKADIATAILSDVLGMNGDKSNREIKSEIILRQTAVDNVMNIYDEDMTLGGIKFKEIKNRAEQHKRAIDNATNYIKNNFGISGLGKQVDKELFIECLNSITLDIESNGAGRSEDGVLAIETNDLDISEWNDEGTTQTRMIKLLIHEAYHLYLYKTDKHIGDATKEEEATAEMLALRTMANLCNNDSTLKPFEIYGSSIENYTSNEIIANNPRFCSDFLSGYQNHAGTVDEAIKKAKSNVKL